MLFRITAKFRLVVRYVLRKLVHAFSDAFDFAYTAQPELQNMQNILVPP